MEQIFIQGSSLKLLFPYQVSNVSAIGCKSDNIRGALNPLNTTINYFEDIARWIGPTPSHDRKAGDVAQ